MHRPQADTNITAAGISRESFVLVLATWTIERTRRFLGGMHYTHIVILRIEHEERCHFLVSRERLNAVFARHEKSATLQAAFKLHAEAATLVISGDTPIEEIPPGEVLVKVGDRLAGFTNADEPLVRAMTARDAPPHKSVSAADRVAVLKSFSAFPMLKVADEVACDLPFDILVGFCLKPDLHTAGGMAAVILENPDLEQHCLVLMVCDGVEIDKALVYLPLRANATVSLVGKIREGFAHPSIKAMFVYRDQIIASVVRTILVTSCSSEMGTISQASVAEVRANPCRILLPRAEQAVDFTVSITSKSDGSLEWRMVAPAFPGVLGTIKIETPPLNSREFAGDLIRDLDPLGFSGPLARNILESVGQDIAAYVPEKFFEVLQVLQRNLQHPPVILLLTNETYVPWELAYLHEPLDSSAPPFLSAQTVIGRWLEDPNVMLPPVVDLEINRFTTVASDYSKSSGQRLIKALAEQNALGKWKTINLEATLPEMQTLISGAAVRGHLVHFAIHGYSDPLANDQHLLLADNERLPAKSMAGAHRCGETPRFAFVFLNACQVGTPGRSLGHAGGFPGELVRRGTMGFVAPLWEVHDDEAYDAALEFYEDVFERGLPVGSALLSRRRRYEDGSTTPLSYIYYGHPALRLSRGL